MTSFEKLERFTRTLGGSGTANFDINGVAPSLGGTSSDYASITMRVGNDGTNFKIFDQNPKFRANLNMGNVGATNNVQGFVGMGAVTVDATGHTFTVRHIGFEFLRAAGSTDLFATVADGTTQSKTSMATGLASNDDLEVLADVTTSGSSASFYCRINGGNWSSATTIASNLPATSSAGNLLQFSVSAVSTSGLLGIVCLGASYMR